MASFRKRGGKWSGSFEMATIDGKRKRYEKGGFKTKKDAEQHIREKMIEYENTGRTQDPSDISVSDYFDYWLENDARMNAKFNTYLAHLTPVRSKIKPALGHYRLRQLSPATIQEFINNLIKEGYSISYVRAIKSTLTLALNYAVYPLGYIPQSPMQYVKVPKRNYSFNKKNQTVSDEDIERIFARFPEGHHFFIPLQIAYMTGMRKGETIGLTWDDVNLDAYVININQQMYSYEDGYCLAVPKSETSIRQIKIGKTLAGILRRHKRQQSEYKLMYGQHYTRYYEDHRLDPKNGQTVRMISTQIGVGKEIDFVCTRENGKVIDTGTMEYLSRVIHQELGIKAFKFHNLRHTHATKLIEANANPKGVQDRLGHSNSTTTDGYIEATKKISDETAEIYENTINLSILSTK